MNSRIFVTRHIRLGYTLGDSPMAGSYLRNCFQMDKFVRLCFLEVFSQVSALCRINLVEPVLSDFLETP